MVKLLIIADDFTGALDTGIQFVNKGIATQVFTKRRTLRSAGISEVSFRQFWTEADTTKFIFCRGIRR